MKHEVTAISSDDLGGESACWAPLLDEDDRMPEPRERQRDNDGDQSDPCESRLTDDARRTTTN